MNQDKPKPTKTDWETYTDDIDEEDLLTSDWEHKAWLTKAKIKSQFTTARDFIIKELQLSRLDRSLAYIYSLKLAAAEEWFNLGYPELAMRRMVHLLGKLNLFRSVGGFERINQNPATSAVLRYDMTDEQLEKINQPEEEESRPPNLRFIKKLIRR